MVWCLLSSCASGKHLKSKCVYVSNCKKSNNNYKCVCFAPSALGSRLQYPESCRCFRLSLRCHCTANLQNSSCGLHKVAVSKHRMMRSCAGYQITVIVRVCGEGACCGISLGWNSVHSVPSKANTNFPF